MNVLFLSGWHKYRGKLDSLDYNQSSLRDVLIASGWNVFDKQVLDESSIYEAYSPLEGLPLLVIYTGHGLASSSPYPNIFPVNRAFSLLSIGRTGTTSYIMDYCNVNDGEEPLFQNVVNHGSPIFSTRCLDPRQGYLICMRQQVCGFTRGSGTVFNLGMCGVFYHFNCCNISQFCQVLNGYCNAEYKTKGYVKNQRVKYVITLNGSNPGTSKFSEGDIRRIMTSMKWPQPGFQAVTGLAPEEDGLELIVHLGDSVAVLEEIQPDGTDELLINPEDIQLMVHDAVAAVEVADGMASESHEIAVSAAARGSAKPSD